MNSLNLRVSTVKTGDNVKKNAEMRATLVALPRHYELSESSYCVSLKEAKSIPEQVAAVKNIFKNLGSDPAALQFLADLYFHCPAKHPVRMQILKLLITAARLGTGSVDESSIVSALAHSLQRLVEQTKAETESTKWNCTITSLTGCFENFSCGLAALALSLAPVFPFLCASVPKYLAELGVLSSPSVRNEYYLYIHTSIRLILSCVQEFSAQLKEPSAAAEQQLLLRQMNVVARQIIHDDEIPMDTRTNAGILLASIAKLFNEYDGFLQAVRQTRDPNEIALCVGVVNTFDQHDFQRTSADIRDICSKIDEIAHAHATVPAILLCGARALYQISKIILSFDWQQAPQANGLDDAKLILRKLLIFSFGFLEHHMDSVRHICRDLLRNIVASARKIQFEFLLQKVYDACNSERLSLSMKCVVLQQAAAVLGAEEIIGKCPDLFAQLFGEHLGRDFMVNNLFDALMCASHKELAYPAWLKQWLHYLLDIAAANDARLPDIETLVVKAVKCEPKCVQDIIEQDAVPLPISTKLSALWAVRKTGLKMENFNDIMQKFSKCLLLSILSNCDETRIMALRLLVETHKTTELLTALECEHILTYLEYNANCQSPATRQKTLGLLSKALVRLELNLLKVLKDSKGNEQSVPSLHLKFLLDFMRILVNNLFPGANFSRRSVSLQLLEQCLRICINCDLDLEQVLPPQTIPTLVETLADTYEANKELAANILALLEDKLECNLIAAHNLQINPTQMQTLLTSVRPTDSVTAAYQLQLFCNHTERAQSAFGDYEPPAYSASHYGALRWLLLELKIGLKMAKLSLLQAAKLNPLYGLLFAAKHLLQRLDFGALAQEISWRIVIAELIVVCKELTMVVAPVVNSSSPEGHLPNDFGELPASFGEEEEITDVDGNMSSSQANCKILSPKLAKVDLTAVKTTPQMVLLCAWRTVKEVSLILGEIVLRSPIQFGMNKPTPADEQQFLVTKEQILEVGEHFKLLLAETKHRGAFEQAYVGFSKLCCRLWRVEATDLNCLPMQWLRELIALISRDEQINEKICATRRSAGVPFMVQALITSELQVGSTKSLLYAMTHLLQLCSNAERTAEARTHALNILRALFRCTDLNESVGEFVAEGVMCAIRAYDADTWSERNSATLLFAALITRVFGVQRTRDSENLSVRNKMTGRVFFLRYPRLYDFFLSELQVASALVREQQKAQKLHPLLLILSRLYCSALEGTESNLKLSEFIPFISDCAACPELQTRFLAAKAVVALIAKDAVSVTILRKCAAIVMSGDNPTQLNLNIIHGHLLQILLLIRAHKTLETELIGDISCTLIAFYEKTQLQNAIILKVMLDIFSEILNGLSSLNYPQGTIHSLLHFATQPQLHTAALSSFYPVLRKSFYLYSLHTLRLTLPFGALSDYLLNQPFLSAESSSIQLEQAETCLNVILLVLLMPPSSPTSSPAAAAAASSPAAEVTEAIAEFEISAAEVQFVRVLDAETHQELAAELRRSKALQGTLKLVITQPTLYYPECAMKAYAILSRLEHFDFTLSSLIKDSQRHPGDVKSPLAMCVERLVLQQGVNYKISQLCLEYLCEIVQPWHPDCLRLKASKILSHIAVHYTRALEKKKLAFVRSYIGLMLSLLMDDDYDIRDNTSKIVLNNLPDDIEMENVVSTMAQRLFLQATADILLAIKADDNYILDVFKIITETLTLASGGAPAADSDDNSNGGGNSPGNTSQSSSNTGGASGSDLDVFDKNESNVFAEPLKAISDSIVVFRNTFGERAKVLSFVNDYKVY